LHAAPKETTMPKLTRIYTRTGDDGTTGLVGGQRVKKNALRIAAYGTVDELSSAIGAARAALGDVRRGRAIDQAHAVAVAGELDEWLAWTHDLLFNVGSELATPPESRRPESPAVRETDVTALERSIDRAQTELTPLTKFIHPGGSNAGAALHVARTIARRAERLLVTLAENSDVAPEIRRYVNRLSDALFVWARWINHALGQTEHIWNAHTAPPS
ncbi:MAG: cob(I)yrinic acid a,c-diamide adenosyltransferase, partial [Vulcanimicrobiaceae bacterium]